MKVLLIDNYDSFTYNLVHYLQDVSPDVDVTVLRNDAVTVDEALTQDARAIVLSPGPCTPSEAGICIELVKRAPDTLPVLGVCLGHQAIGEAMGGVVEGAQTIIHGKTWDVNVLGGALFSGVPTRFKAVRYHSLAIRRRDIPSTLTIDAVTPEGEIMAVSHVSRPVYGVQFHPESIGSEHGMTILSNFLRQAGLK